MIQQIKKLIKFPKAMVHYTNDHGDSPEQCSNCSHYVNRSVCEIVTGNIVPEGWCNRWRSE